MNVTSWVFELTSDSSSDFWERRSVQDSVEQINGVLASSTFRPKSFPD